MGGLGEDYELGGGLVNTLSTSSGIEISWSQHTIWKSDI